MSELNITKDEARDLAEFIDENICGAIRRFADIDGINWLRKKVRIYDKLADYGGYISLDEIEPDRLG